MENDDFLEYRREFLLNYYEWARRYAVSEANGNYDTIRRIPCRIVWRFFEYFDSMTPEDRELLITGVLTRSHARYLPELQSRISLRQRTLIDVYIKPSVLLLTRNELGLIKRREAGEVAIVGHAVLGKIANSVLTHIFKKKPEVWEGGVFRWSIPVGSHILHTYLDIGSRLRQICYSHSICMEKRDDLRFIENASLLSWTGISGMTAWEFVEESGVEEFEGLFRGIISRFVNAVPDLLVL